MTHDDLMKLMLTHFPEAELGEDNDGQLVIYTGLTTQDDGVTVVPMEDGVSEPEQPDRT